MFVLQECRSAVKNLIVKKDSAEDGLFGVETDWNFFFRSLINYIWCLRAVGHPVF